jgi:hypothetical protein
MKQVLGALVKGLNQLREAVWIGFPNTMWGLQINLIRLQGSSAMIVLAAAGIGSSHGIQVTVND